MGARPDTGGGGARTGGSAGSGGWWPSPWSAASAAAGKVSRSGLQVEGDSVFWTESRPAEGGRQVVVRARPGKAPIDVSPPGASVRTRVHEYGGAAATVSGGSVFYVDQQDQQWYRVPLEPAAGPVIPVRLTPEATPEGTSNRFADGQVTAAGWWLVCVVERHDGRVTEHRLAAVAVDGSQRMVTLAADGDFVAAPRPSPDGRWLAWVGWDHPSMPWDSSVLWLAGIEESETGVAIVGPRRVAGGPDCSVGQPHWCDDGSLVFVDDRTGWWLPYRLDPAAPAAPTAAAGAGTPLVEVKVEFHAPDWVLGQSTMAEVGEGWLVGRAQLDGRDQLLRFPASGRPRSGTPGRPVARPGPPEQVDQPCVSLSAVAARPGRDGGGTVFVIGSTPTEAHGVFELAAGGSVRRLSTAPARAAHAGDVSVGRPYRASTPAGPVPGLFFAPVNRAVATGSSEGPPPVVVFCHGGPTSSADPGFDPVVQFLTSRGLAVAAVDYRGSSGHGRDYRQRLAGQWGEADVDDCADYALALGRAGLVDGDRMAIRGTSAGGFTALNALIRAGCFAGAVAWYGVTDLEALATDTHDFESRYLDSLVGPWPASADIYRARSPIHHPDRVSGHVLLLQGTDDPVVPADQSERFAARLVEHGVPCRLVLFEGESHGFRRAETIEAALSAELTFYRSVFAVP